MVFTALLEGLLLEYQTVALRPLLPAGVDWHAGHAAQRRTKGTEVH